MHARSTAAVHSLGFAVCVLTLHPTSTLLLSSEVLLATYVHTSGVLGVANQS
jgi:hypothetical protein